MPDIINRYKNWISDRGQRGDTIVEVLISIVILALVITSAYALSTRSLHSGISAENRSRAQSIAQTQVNRLQAAASASSTGNTTAKSYLATYTSYGSNPFCIHADGSSDPAPAPYNTCTDAQSLFGVAVKYDKVNKVFTVFSTWKRVGATPDNSVTLYYKLPSGFSDFSVKANPNSFQTKKGAALLSTVTTSIFSDFNADITLSFTPPTGVNITGTFNSNTIAKPGNGHTALQIKVGGSVANGTYVAKVNGASGSVTHSANVTIDVKDTNPCDFCCQNPNDSGCNVGGGSTCAICGCPGHDADCPKPPPGIGLGGSPTPPPCPVYLNFNSSDNVQPTFGALFIKHLFKFATNATPGGDDCTCVYGACGPTGDICLDRNLGDECNQQRDKNSALAGTYCDSSGCYHYTYNADGSITVTKTSNSDCAGGCEPPTGWRQPDPGDCVGGETYCYCFANPTDPTCTAASGSGGAPDSYSPGPGSGSGGCGYDPKQQGTNPYFGNFLHNVFSPRFGMIVC